MRLPVSWLKEYVDFEDTPKGLAEKLTFSGTEVEGIETIGSAFTGIVVGEVREVRPHPNADRLTLCKVWDGRTETEVVCGAPNVKAGLKSAFAPVGATLPNGTQLKRAKIRGVESAGMLCAEDELGLSGQHAGILVIDSQYPAGTPLSEVFGAPETVLELEITPNRPDCLSLIGMAREVAALHAGRLKWPEISAPGAEPSAVRFSVDVEDTHGCPRYIARILENVRMAPSPEWMQRRLGLAGVRPINNVVDITNYVQLECGQPLHAFDHELLHQGRIVVRPARPGEQLTSLDGVRRELSTDMLVIADADRPVALAGVMGGADSEIRGTTRTVLLESAAFNPVSIRATSRKLGLTTESSYRFERGVDINLVDWASRRAAALMVELAGARVAGKVIDVYPNPPAEREIGCRFDRVQTLLGKPVDPSEIQKVFELLSLRVTRADAQHCTIRIPSFRRDLEREVDLIEEFARVHGLNNIPARPPRAEIVAGASHAHTRALNSSRAGLIGLGLHEVVNYSLVSDALLDLFDAAGAPRRIHVANPISEDQSVLRTHLLPQLMETLGRNYSRQGRRMSCFEIGRVFERVNGQPAEELRLAVGLMGPAGRIGLDQRSPVDPEEMFLWIKGLWERLAAAHGFRPPEGEPLRSPFLEESCAVSYPLSGPGGPSAVLGLMATTITRTWRITEPVGVLELPLAPWLDQAGKRGNLIPLAAYPSVTRDMAIVAGEAVKHADILKIAWKAATDDLENIELFDIFRGPGIGPGKKSMAYSFTYRSLKRTLTDDEANRYHDAVKRSLKKELAVDIREA